MVCCSANVANLLVHTDLNALSVIQFAVDVLQVEHILVVGHYGCGGVLAALQDIRVGLADNWIRHVKDVRDKHRELLAALAPARIGAAPQPPHLLGLANEAISRAPLFVSVSCHAPEWSPDGPQYPPDHPYWQTQAATKAS